ncbi:MAG: ABC transporter permease [Acidobacteriota bacterium]
MFGSIRLAVHRILQEKRRSALNAGLMAIGIGAATTAFGVLDAVLLQPLPYLEPESLVAVSSASPQRGIADANVSMGDFVYWRERSRSLQAVAALGYAELVLTGAGEPERVPTAAVSWNFLSTLGVRPVLGRNFLPEEETPGRDQVVLLSHDFWKRRFGGDQAIVGSNLILSGYTFEVVGVLPAGFSPYGLPVDFWSPMSIDHDHLVRQRRGIGVIGRLRPGVTLSAVQEEMKILSSNLESQFPDTNSGWSAVVTPLKRKVIGDSRATVLIMFIAALAVLLLAVGNMANLMLTDSLGRRHEVMIRQALGARRFDVAKPQLFENLLLAACGSGAGLFLAKIDLAVIASQNSLQVPRLRDAHVGPEALVFALGLTFGIAFALGLIPTLFVERGAAKALRSQGASTGERAAAGVVVAEITLAYVLLVSAVLLTRTFREISNIDPGFQAKNLVVLNISLPMNKYVDDEHQLAFFHQVIASLRQMPQVEGAAASSNVPLNRAALNIDVPVSPSQAQSNTERDERAALRLITPELFTTMKIAMKAGRDFTELDNLTAKRVAIVNDVLAKRLWPTKSAVGEPIRLSYEGEADYEVVGVVSNVRRGAAERDVVPEVFLSYSQHPQFFASLVVRVRGGTEASIGALKSAVWAVDRDQDMTVKTMEGLVADERSPRSFLVNQLAVLSTVALLIAALGIFSVISYAAQKQRFALGIRIALGATRGSVLRALLSRILRLASAGLVLGMVLAYFVAHLLARAFFQLKEVDPWSLSVALVVLAVAALAGSYLPVRSALRTDPLLVLRKA